MQFGILYLSHFNDMNIIFIITLWKNKFDEE